MKLHEIALTEEQLDEARLRHALAAAGLAGSLALSGAAAEDRPSSQQLSPLPSTTASHTIRSPQQLVSASPIPALTQAILDKYDVDPRLAQRVATAAKKYERPTFPKAEDILAIIGIESSFDPSSVSGLPRDPAKGLMQVRPGVWNLSAKSLSTIDKQIKVGSTILHSYYNKLQSIPDAVHAYNVGLTNFNHGTNLNPDYVRKFADERKLYSEVM